MSFSERNIHIAGEEHEPEFGGPENPEDSSDKKEGKPKKEILVHARESYLNFSEDFKGVVEGYLGTGDLPFTCNPGGWYINFETLTINADPNFFLEKGYTQSESLFATFHEAEHFLDYIRDRDTVDNFFTRTKERRTDTKRDIVAKASTRRLYNCLEDIVVNKSVMSRWYDGGKAKDSLYPKLFASSDFRDQPLSRQFMYTLLRKAMLPNEEVNIAPEVQAYFDEGKISHEFIAKITETDLQGKPKVSAEDRYIWYRMKCESIFLELLQKDLDNYDEQKKKKGDKSEDREEGEKGEPGEPGENTEKQPEDPDGESTQSDDIDYSDFMKDPMKDVIPDPIDMDKIKDILDKMEKRKKDDAFEKAMGVTQEQFDAYKRDYSRVSEYVEQLSGIFDRVISKRVHVRRVLRRQVKEGPMLNPARVADAIAQIEAGNFEPRVMLDYENQESIENVPTEFEISFVGDISGSMQGEKAIMQRRLMVLGLEAINAFRQRIEKERGRGKNIDLTLSTEVRAFGDTDTCVLPLRKSITHNERIHVREFFANDPGGSNNEMATFAELDKQIDRENIAKMKKGDLKKVILFFTDGESDAHSIQKAIQQLYKKVGATPDESNNFVIACIGFKGGITAINTYAPNGYYAESFNDVADIFEKFLAGMLDSL